MEHHLVRVEGMPRKVALRADGLEATADRREYKGEFDHYTMRVRASGEASAAIKQIGKEQAEHCSVREEAGFLVINCPLSGKPQTPETLAVLDKI